MTTIFAISNHKGGVAKTTSCLSLGACLAKQGCRTLIVDLDAQAHLTLSAGLDPDELAFSIVDWLTAPYELPPTDVIQPTTIPGLEILPGDMRLASLEHQLVNEDDFETRLVRLLAPWQANYDFILFDCPPSLSGFTLMALTAAHCALIPVPCEYFATRGLMRLLDLVEAVRERTNPNLNYALFVSLFDKRTKVSHSILNQLQDHFGEQMLKTVICLDTRVRESALTNEPILTYAPKSRASLQYQELAVELMQRFDTTAHVQKSPTGAAE